MAKKKAATKKSSGSTKPAKKAASNNKRNEKVTSKTTTKASAKKGNVKIDAKTLAKSNGVQTNGVKKPTAAKKAQPEKTSIKKIATSATSSQHTKQKLNGTEDQRGLNPQTYQMLRQDIISTLWKYDEITFDELCAAMEKIHGKNFVNDSIKYVKQVMTDLINIELIESIDRDANRSIYRIRQRLSE